MYLIHQTPWKVSKKHKKQNIISFNNAYTWFEKSGRSNCYKYPCIQVLMHKLFPFILHPGNASISVTYIIAAV